MKLANRWQLICLIFVMAYVVIEASAQQNSVSEQCKEVTKHVSRTVRTCKMIAMGHAVALVIMIFSAILAHNMMQNPNMKQTLFFCGFSLLCAVCFWVLWHHTIPKTIQSESSTCVVIMNRYEDPLDICNAKFTKDQRLECAACPKKEYVEKECSQDLHENNKTTFRTAWIWQLIIDVLCVCIDLVIYGQLSWVRQSP